MTKVKRLVTAFILTILFFNIANAQFAYGDSWYNNPLGFEPLQLHTGMGLLVPALAVGTCILLTKNDTNLEHRLTIYNEAGLSWGYKYPHTFMPQNNTGVNFQLRKFLSVGADFSVYFPKDDFNTTMGFAIRPFARFYPINKQSWRLYFESGGGFVFFCDEFPKPTNQDKRLGTQWNGTTKYGIGSEINVSKTIAILFGVRHLHVSNGNTKGVERNPSHDSNGFFVGLSYRM